MYNVLKVIYFANKHHLSEYGKFIYDDSYAAMAKGAVPSMAYDMVKYARGDGAPYCDAWSTIKDSFIVEDNIKLIPIRDVNLKYLSETDVQCLDKAISDYGTLSFSKLKKISHNDPAYKNAGINDSISLKAIIESLPNSDELLDYLSD